MQQNWSVNHGAEADGRNAYTSEVARIGSAGKDLNFRFQFSIKKRVINADNANNLQFSYNSSTADLKASQ